MPTMGKIIPGMIVGNAIERKVQPWGFPILAARVVDGYGQFSQTLTPPSS